MEMILLIYPGTHTMNLLKYIFEVEIQFSAYNRYYRYNFQVQVYAEWEGLEPFLLRVSIPDE